MPSEVHCYLSGNPIHDRVLTAFAHGCDADLRSIDDYSPSDVGVVFGVEKKALEFTKKRGRVIKEQKAIGKQVVILETGYINRGDGGEHYYAAGLNGLNGWGDFRNEDSPDDRWLDLDIELKAPSAAAGLGAIILCGQIPWDASVQDTDHPEWLVETARDILQRTDRRLVFRPHPKCPIRAFPHVLYALLPPSKRTLADDLPHTGTIVTYNSNSGVEALISGVPTICLGEGDMVGKAAYRSLDHLDTKALPPREQWLNDLAYAQWNLTEMAEGKTWAHLFQ